MSKTSNTLGTAHLWLAQVVLKTGASAGSAKKKRRIFLAAAGLLVRFSSWPLEGDKNVSFKGTKGRLVRGNRQMRRRSSNDRSKGDNDKHTSSPPISPALRPSFLGPPFFSSSESTPVLTTPGKLRYAHEDIMSVFR